ncbi:N-acetyltransferase family protein [Parabacteroides sp. OttesenSCG-928-G07]|nr:N-acetyltransferase family protein [Parabacteroides sp. OttesenSCG-928-G07]
MHIRKVTPDDAKAICLIYNYYIEHTAITFETKPVSVAEIQRRIKDVLKNNYPYYVGEINNRVVGYCYLSAWKQRAAYNPTAEVTIYLDKDFKGKGLGYTFYEYLFKYLDKKRFHSLIAGITLPNEASVRLHEGFGFHQVSFMPEIGYKFDKWLSVGHWHLLLD